MKWMILLSSLIIVSCSSTKYYIVRHAEKAPVPAGASQMMASDPPLSEKGLVRAIELREELRGENIEHFYSTNFKRTRSTAQPLSELRGSTPLQLYSPRPDSLDAFIATLKRIKRGNVLVVGHSNTVDDITNKLTGEKSIPADLDDSEYDNLFIVKRKGKKYSFSRRKYGSK